jgi:predicted CxxxxCH...CXXCH cytochrome family protein
MDCMYCHFSADRSVDAGLPPVGTCAGCHRLIPGTANPQEIQKLMGFAQRAEAIPWVRVYKVADHVHFPHMRHVNAGLACQQCHGPVETMGAIEERDPAWPGNNMGKCISCHVESGVRRDCAICHY